MYLEDWSSGFGDSRDYVYGLVSGTQDLGINHYLLPDTLGLFSPQVYDSVKEMKEQFSNEEFDFHPHNDYGLATTVSSLR